MTIQARVLLVAFKQFIVQIYKDAMLILLCIAPFLCGCFFKYILPLLEKLLSGYLPLESILKPYYLLFDLLLGALTPLLYCFAAAYVILAEIDDGISKYLAVTPVGKKGYLISRIGFPALIAFFISVLALMLFHISNISVVEMIGVSLVFSLLGIITALLVVALSANKVEGMAVSKLTGLFFLGLPAPFFIKGSMQYILFFLPSFWVAKYTVEDKLLFLLVGMIVSIVWIRILYQKFNNKIR
jgi:hypothetical protein